MKKIKKQYLNDKIPCPLTKQIVSVRLIPESLYEIYAQKGYEFLFEQEVKVNKVKVDVVIDKNQNN